MTELFTLKTQFGPINILDIDGCLETLTNPEFNQSVQTIHFLNAYSLVLANLDIDLYASFSAGICFCDSRILAIYSRIVSCPIRQIRGSDYLKTFLGGQQSEMHFFVTGGKSSGAEIRSRVASLHGLDIIASSFQPSFSSNIDLIANEVVPELSLYRPKYVWIGIGTPKQDILARKLIEIFPTNYFCVGAALNFLMGEIAECPTWLSKIGMEWFFRLLQEPKRLWRRYLFGNVHFIRLLLKDFYNRLNLVI